MALSLTSGLIFATEGTERAESAEGWSDPGIINWTYHAFPNVHAIVVQDTTSANSAPSVAKNCRSCVGAARDAQRRLLRHQATET